ALSPWAGRCCSRSMSPRAAPTPSSPRPSRRPSSSTRCGRPTRKLSDRSFVLCGTVWGMDGRVLRGDRTRAAVLDRAMAMATEAGLDGLSLGQLAEALGVSKSGLFAHWRSKEERQLATVEDARHGWGARGSGPPLSAPRGV